MAHDFKRYPELTNAQMQLYYFDSPHKQITEGFTARVVKVTDGDTIRVECDFRDFTFPIRFANTAAPELDEGGKDSQKWLENEILGEEVEVIIDQKNRVGKWGRLLGEIMFRGMNMNEASLREGHAVPFSERKVGLSPDFNKSLEAKWS